MIKETQIKLYESMLRIRMLEEEIAHRYSEGLMRCPTHLSIGQEAVAAAVGVCLDKTDLAISTHRGHAHYIGKGGDINAMVAELYGKATGCSKGKGGSMHLVDLSVGFMGTSAIVGNSIPVGVGFALSSKVKNKKEISCVFFGEGATEEGAYYESINFAVLKNLPVLFICENNLYSVYSPLKVRQPDGRSITEVASVMGLSVNNADGNDVLAAYEAINRAVININNNEGPQLIEFSTYRWREHCGVNFDNDIGYRSEDEFNFWKMKDPISNFEQKLRAEQRFTEIDLEEIKKNVLNEILEAFKYAEASPFPNKKEAYIGEYATEIK